MNEAALNTFEMSSAPKEESLQDVTNRVGELLGSLEEALEHYPEVTLPGGETVEVTAECDQCVARAQRLLEGIKGLREQQQEGNNYHGERAAAQLEAAAEHLEGFLRVRADLHGEASKSAEAQQLAETVDVLVQRLLPMQAAHNEEYTAGETA